VLLIRWRPSGGRGEYEYLAQSHDLRGKSIRVRVPGTGKEIRTDVRFDFKDGKPRLRRDAPNDRSVLNLPPLVAAIAALPKPKRSDLTGKLELPLADGGYVVSELGVEIRDQTGAEVVIEPIYLRPLYGDVIDIEERLGELRTKQAIGVELENFLRLLDTGENSQQLAGAASIVSELYPANESTEVPPTPEATPEDDDIENYVGREGKAKIRIHRIKERDRKLVKLAKRLFRRTHGSLHCECCATDFELRYGQLGYDYIEAHHRTPLSLLSGDIETTPDDLAMLCSNCHRMAHRATDCSMDDVVAALRVSGAVSGASLQIRT
jgi:5-methylcytosine-specific restriction endonuclease McrA